MKNLRRIMAIIGILLLLGIYASTMVFALMKHPLADRFLMASIFCTVVFRTLLSFALGKWLGWGVIGTSLAMGLDWCLKGILDIVRFNSGKWRGHRVI